MSPDATPSTDWREQVAPDEDDLFAGYARQLGEVQRIKSERYGTGRALHRKQVLGLAGTLTVAADLPAHAAHGLFARPGDHEVLVRLSNGGIDRAKDATPDIRGFAIKVRGVTGPGALGFDTASQDFLLINQPAFGAAGAGEFVELVVASAQGRGALVKWAVSRHGLRGGLSLLRRTAATLGRPFTGFATETFWSAAPLACGPYAVRVRLVPVRPSPPGPDATQSWADDMSARLAGGPLTFHLALQFFTSEAVTPIEDASVDWPTPYLTVATLTLAMQQTSSAAGEVLQAEVEAASFDPWSALVEHRPLGQIMRARKAAYRTSQLGRGRS